MSEYYLTSHGGDERLFIAPINAGMAAENNMSIDDSIGYFLCRETDERGSKQVFILAKLASEEAAFELGDILGLS